MKMDNGNSNQTILNRITPAQIFLIITLCAALFAAFKVIQPYFSSIVMAGLIASLTQPVFKWILKRVKGRKNTAAFLCCLLLIFVVVIPLTFIGIALIDQGLSVSHSAQQWIKSGNANAILESERVQSLKDYVDKYSFGYDIKKLNLTDKIISSSSAVAKFVFDQSGSIAANLSAKLMNFGMMIFIYFFFIRDGEELMKHVLHMSPLSSTQESRIIERVKGIARSVFLGTILTALAQGIAAGIGFAICGVQALFWGTILAFSSLVPVVGTALVWIPTVLYLFLTGKSGYAIFFAIYSIIVVGSVDNFLRPVFMKGAGGMSTFMIFLSVIGGIQLFGISGILYGPLTFGLAWILLIIYELEFQDYLKQQDET